MNLKYNDTICAPATSVGTGAISVIRVSGPESLAIADRVVKCRKGTLSDAPGYSMKYGTVYKASAAEDSDFPGTGAKREILDDVVVAVFRAPHSYTGEDSVEISCHSSSYIVTELLGLLVSAGARMAEPGEFTRRAFVNGKMDLAQAEAVADVISASSEVAHRVAVNQLRGGYSLELKSLRDKLLEATAMMELELDFSEEEVEFADRKELRALLESLRAQVSHLAASFRAGNALKNGVPVAIVGAANAGKSTLLNALLGEDRAIVSPIAGTTRDTVEEVLTLEGILFRFIDTAGLRDTSDEIERMGISRSYNALQHADVVIGVLDGTLPPSVVSASAQEIKSQCSEEQTLIFVSNKSDLAEGADELLRVSAADGCPNGGILGVSVADDDIILRVSAKTGDGLDALRTAIVESQRGRFNSGETLVTNLRHYEALTRALASIDRCISGLDSGLSTELLAEDIRAAISELGSVWGEGGITSQETLNLIFAKHCIGK